MSNFRGHITGGLSVATINLIVFSQLNDMKTGVITFITALIFSLYPDQDIASKSQRYLTLFGLLGVGSLMYYDLDSLGIIVILGLIITPLLFPHRKWNHSILNGFVLCLVWMFFLSLFIPISFKNDYIYCIALLSGYGIHLILDKHIKLI